MYFRALMIFCILVCTACTVNAQNCTLDIGGKNIDMIVKIFQLNEAQIGSMEELRAELEITNKTVEEDIQKLFDQHPQSTPEELMTMAGKYKVLQQKIIDASFESDKKLLSLFNEKQYERYLILCEEAIRDPIRIIPVSVEEIIDPE
ncbi:hypothetical protein [Maribacter halichondriae]|uniref:hypothetical protein n=1 Tax=Maribacter halichondriae TaxID=2980554 RepID=UPI0023594C78|nr:hypothetical protein [Maribacter sp. Hal144]